MSGHFFESIVLSCFCEYGWSDQLSVEVRVPKLLFQEVDGLKVLLLEVDRWLEGLLRGHILNLLDQLLVIFVDVLVLVQKSIVFLLILEMTCDLRLHLTSSLL